MLGLGLSLWHGGGGGLPGASAWASRVTANGGTYSAGTLTAVEGLVADLTIAGLYTRSKLVYLNPRCGSNLAAARTPLVSVAGPGFDEAFGTYAAWNETNGFLSSSGAYVELGFVVGDSLGVSNTAFSLGCYMLNDSPSTNRLIGGDDNSFGMMVGYSSLYIILDYDLHRCTAGINTTLNLTKGLCMASFWGDGLGFGARNGAIMGTGWGGNAGAHKTQQMYLDSSLGTSGGDFIGKAMTPEDASNLTWILHTFNTALGRGVAAEGLF